MRIFSRLLLGDLLLASSAARACDICGYFVGITPCATQSDVALMPHCCIVNSYRALGQRPQFQPTGVGLVALGHGFKQTKHLLHPES